MKVKRQVEHQLKNDQGKLKCLITIVELLAPDNIRRVAVRKIVRGAILDTHPDKAKAIDCQVFDKFNQRQACLLAGGANTREQRGNASLDECYAARDYIMFFEARM